MTPFDYYLAVVGSISFLIGVVADANEKDKIICGKLILLGLLLIGIMAWRIS